MNKHSFLLAFAIAAFSPMVFTACSSDGDSDGNGNNGGNTLDNEVVLSMVKGDENEATLLFDNLYIGEDNNFQNSNCHSYTRLAMFGNVNKLSEVSYIPKTGWVYKISARKGLGYVYYVTNDYDKTTSPFCRIYIEDEMRDADGKIIGYDIRYQYPFNGKNIDIDLPKDNLSFTNKGGKEKLMFADSEPIFFTSKSSASWCCAEKVSSFDIPFLTNGVYVVVNPSDTIGESTATITLTTGYGKKKEIKVTRAAAEPVLKIYNNYGSDLSENGITLSIKGGTSTSTKVSTNIPLGDIEIVNTASSWCEATLVKDNSGYNKLQLEATANDTNEKRSGIITLKWKNGDLSASLKVEQDIAYIYLPAGYTIDNPYTKKYYGGKEYLYIYSNLGSDDIKVSNSASWLSTNVYYYDYNENYYVYMLGMNFNSNYISSYDREDIVTISNKKGTIKYSFKVIQSGY